MRRVAEVSYYRNGNNDVKDQYYSKEEYKNSPPMPGRNSGSFVRDVRRVEDLEEEVREETNCTKISKILSKRRRSCRVPSRSLRQNECLLMAAAKGILPNLMKKVKMKRLDSTATTP